MRPKKRAETIFFVLSIFSWLLIPGSHAIASAPFPTERPDRPMSVAFEGIWQGTLTVGEPVPGVCKNVVKPPKKLTVRMCVGTNSEDGIEELQGRVISKRRYRLLQRNARFKKISRRNRIRASYATNGSGSEDATAAFIYFQKNLNNDNSRHGNLVVEIAASDSSELDENGNPLYSAGDLVVSLGNCISGVLVKTAENPACT